MIVPPADARRAVTVTSRTALADPVVAFDLVSADGELLPPWQPGAHVDVELPNGLVRQYSLCGDPNDAGRWCIAVLDEPDGRGGSHFLTTQLTAGTTVTVRGPRNHFALEPARSYLFVAGGIGITPIRSMLLTAQAAGARWQLHYAGRSRNRMAYASVLAEAFPDQVTLYPGDEGGRLDVASLLGTPDPYTQVYCCGPRSLVDAVAAAGQAWAVGAVHVERFVPKVLGGPLRTEPFTVDLMLSGSTVTVPPDRSVLDVVEQAGALVLSSCREGTCGTCETAVVQGAIDHRDSVLTPEEQAAGDTMMICVSRAAGPHLVLEL